MVGSEKWKPGQVVPKVLLGLAPRSDMDIRLVGLWHYSWLLVYQAAKAEG